MRSPARPPHIVRHAPIDSGKLLLAKRLRRAPTYAEQTAWGILRGSALFGLKFRRQQVIAGFVVDFYCSAARLVLELDGGVHDDPAQRAYDDARTQVLARRAIRVVRIPNEDIHEQALRELLAPFAQPKTSA